MASNLSRYYKGAWFVYALLDPRDQLVWYVGCTTDFHRRIRQHLEGYYTGMPELYDWLGSLLLSGMLPEYKLLECGTGMGWVAAEQAWIAKHRKENQRLINKTSGGTGSTGLPHGTTESTKKKISASLTGRKGTNAGWKMTEEQKAAISARNSGNRYRSDYLMRMKRNERKLARTTSSNNPEGAGGAKV